MRIRILEVLATLRRAGAERMAVSLAGGLDRSRFETEVASLFEAFTQGFEPVLQASGVPVDHLGKHPGLDLRMVPRLARVMQRFRPSIVHTHSYVMRYALPAAIAAGRPRLVHTVHNIAQKEVNSLGQWIHRAAFQTGASAIAVSTEVAQSFRHVYGIDPAAVIPNGIDLDCFGVVAPRWRKENGFGEEDGLIVSVARLDPQKNPLLLIEAFAHGLRSQDRWHLLLAGTGGLREAAIAQAARLGIAGRVHFLGVRPDIPQILASCDLFALSADWEGSPMALIEAMASGLPVVATAVGGVPELVEHGATGLLSPPGDARALAEALAALAADADRRKAFSTRARERARRFSATAMIEAYAAVFERLSGEPQ